ncbi:MAG TPA: PatB family C-S lyase [Vicinamibacterales bacterium]|jgi:cystathionine beta-lyase
MLFDFDAVLDRRRTHSLKWDHCATEFGLDDVIPMWVADMDFAAPPAVVEAVKARAAHGAYGYVSVPESFWQAVIEWLRTRHGWDVERGWLLRAPGVVPALSLCINALTEPGDAIIVQSPVYYPFFSAVTRNGRRLVRNPLVVDENGAYRMDFDDLESRIDSGTRMLILCSPHNPVGRVWTRAELTRLGEVCERHNLLVLSDEIHMDLVFDGRRHVPFASIAPNLAARTVTCVAPSKTFNVAGLSMSIVVASNPELHARYEAAFAASGLGIPNLFGTVGLEAAYRGGAEWLDELLRYLETNVAFADRFIHDRIPQLRFVRPEGTYLALIDGRGLGMAQAALDEFFLREAGVYFDSGPWFGEECQGFERINLGCPRATLAEALTRIERAVNARRTT